MILQPQNVDDAYVELIDHILTEGQSTDDRTGVGTTHIVGHTLKFDLAQGFPVVSIMKTPYESAFGEMMAFLNGATNISEFHAWGTRVWDEFADPVTGELGPVYGAQWRSWDDGSGTRIDQIASAVDLLVNPKPSRRILVNGWNPTHHPDPTLRPFENPSRGKMCLTACHVMHQLLIDKGPSGAQRLNMLMYLRSSDVGLGLKFNMAQYAMLLHRYAHATDMVPGTLIINIGDAHIYNNHRDELSAAVQRWKDLWAGKEQERASQTSPFLHFHSSDEPTWWDEQKRTPTVQERLDWLVGYNKPRPMNGMMQVHNYNPQRFVKLPIAV
jgi:thymidylate synthase